MELLIEKIIASGMVFHPLSPGDCVRRILEAVSSGLLINGPGVLDPCEKEPTDALASLTKQQREDITVSAQHFLRCTAFRKIYLVLGMEPFAVQKYLGKFQPRFIRKRRRSDSESATGADGDKASGGGDGTCVKMIKTVNEVTPETPTVADARQEIMASDN